NVRQLRHDADDSCPIGPDGRRQHTYDYREGGCRQVRNAEVSANLGWAMPGTGSAIVMRRGEGWWGGGGVVCEERGQAMPCVPQGAGACLCWSLSLPISIPNQQPETHGKEANESIDILPAERRLARRDRGGYGCDAAGALPTHVERVDRTR